MTKNGGCVGDLMAFLKQYDQALMFYDMASRYRPMIRSYEKEGERFSINHGKKGRSHCRSSTGSWISTGTITAALTRQGDLLVLQGDLNGALAYYENKRSRPTRRIQSSAAEIGDVLPRFSMWKQQSCTVSQLTFQSRSGR
jgi:hypothetical protein